MESLSDGLFQTDNGSGDMVLGCLNSVYEYEADVIFTRSMKKRLVCDPCRLLCRPPSRLLRCLWNIA